MHGFYAIFVVRGLADVDGRPTEQIRRLAVWVEGALGFEGGPATPVRREELDQLPMLAHVVTAEEVSALADDLHVKI